MNTLLIGPRASGKTELGRRLAARRGLAFVDLDDVVLRAFPEATVAKVWATHGEAAWRRAEEESLATVLAADGQVVALGGGTPMIPGARSGIEAAREAGRAKVIYLQCGDDVLAARLRADPGDRPSLTGAAVAAEVAEIRRQREPTYLALADVVHRADDHAHDHAHDHTDMEGAVDDLERVLFGSGPEIRRR